MTEQERWVDALEGEKKFWNEHSYDAPTYIEEKNLLTKHGIITDNLKLLDIGGGANSIVDILPGERHSIDPLMDFYLNKYNLQNNVDRIKGIGEDLPFKNDSLDIIFCLNALDHAKDPSKVLGEINRCLKKDGIFFMTLNCYSPVIAWVLRFSEKIGAGDICHPQCFTIDEIKNILASYKFKSIDEQWDPLFEQTVKDYLNNVEPKLPFLQKLKQVQKLRGTAYLFKRALVLPLHFFANHFWKTYPRVYFICKKEESINAENNIA